MSRRGRHRSILRDVLSPCSLVLVLLFLLAAALTASSPLAAGPVLPSGAEIAVGAGHGPHLAVFPDGGFVVVWTADCACATVPLAIHARLFDRNGIPETAEFQLLRPYNQSIEGVAAVLGGFVVVWDQAHPPRYSYSVFAAVFDRRGAILVPPFKVHASSPFDRSGGRVAAAAPDGSFWVAWMRSSGERLALTAHYDVVARVFDAGGHPRAGEILVAQGLSMAEGGDLSGPYLDGIETARDGSAVVTMEGGDDPTIWVARFSAAGAPLPIDSPIPQQSAFSFLPFAPAAAVAPDGSFTVAFSTSSGIPVSSAILGRRYDADGAATAADVVQLNSGGSSELVPLLTYLPDGTLVAVWTDIAGRDGHGYGVFGRAFAADGTPSGPDFRVNLVAAGNQTAADLAATPEGNAIALFVRGTYGERLPIVARILRQP